MGKDYKEGFEPTGGLVGSAGWRVKFPVMPLANPTVSACPSARPPSTSQRVKMERGGLTWCSYDGPQISANSIPPGKRYGSQRVGGSLRAAHLAALVRKSSVTNPSVPLKKKIK